MPKTKKTKNNRLIQPVKLRKLHLLVFAVGASIVGVILYVSLAAELPTMYLSPASASLPRGSTFTVRIRENSLTTGVNAVQANLTYPSQLIDYISQSSAGSAFEVGAQAFGGGGVINIARGTYTPKTGDQLVATITFRTRSLVNVAQVNFASDTALISAGTHENLIRSLSQTAPGIYKISDGVPNSL